LALDIEVIAPVAIETDEGTLRAGALIGGFGSPKGTLIQAPDLNDDDYRLWSEMAAKYGYFYSALNPKSNSKFDRRLFEETLNDWVVARRWAPPSVLVHGSTLV
jgi:hypothetical protein